jgi:cobalt/nickel transport protein
MLLPQTASARKGEPVTVVYLWGHPFEHQLFDAPAPRGILVLAPDGKQVNLGKSLEKVSAVTSGKKVVAYRLPFTPDLRGDYLFTLETNPIWMDEDQEFFQDTVKVVLHVQAQRGWDAAAGLPLEILPLTRPYGLQPGMTFQAQVVAAESGLGKRRTQPVASTLVEIEHYNPEPPAQLPPDEHMTRTAKTDPNGVVTCTLTEPGWWCLTAQREGGKRAHEGKDFPIRQRTTLWVFVDEKLPTRPAR